MTATLTIHKGRRALAVRDRLVEVYQAVFTAPPWNEDKSRVEEFSARLSDDAERPGFHAVTAHLGEECVGFATGWVTQPPFPTNRAYGRVLDQRRTRRHPRRSRPRHRRATAPHHPHHTTGTTRLAPHLDPIPRRHPLLPTTRLAPTPHHRHRHRHRSGRRLPRTQPPRRHQGSVSWRISASTAHVHESTMMTDGRPSDRTSHEGGDHVPARRTA